MTQPYRILSLFLLAGSVACGGNRATVTPLVSLDPVGAVRQFMGAVDRNDLTALSALWGTKDGLAAGRMESRELQQRLTVIQRYLVHEDYEVLPPEPGQTLAGEQGEEHLRVRLTRNNCTPVVPVTLVQLDGGWIVKAVDLTQAGNPQRRCSPPQELNSNRGRSTR